MPRPWRVTALLPTAQHLRASYVLHIVVNSLRSPSMPNCEIHPETKLICPKCTASKGGKARAKKMNSEQRSKAARKAVKARWNKRANK